MTEVGPADHAKLLRSKRADASSILLSRKRKLRELFAVATDDHAFPTFDPSDPNAPPTTTAETKFLAECDLSHGHRFSELNVPKCRVHSFDAIKRHLALSDSPSLEPPQQIASKRPLEKGLVKPVPVDNVELEQSLGAIPVTNGLPHQTGTLPTNHEPPRETTVPKEPRIDQDDAEKNGVPAAAESVTLSTLDQPTRESSTNGDASKSTENTLRPVIQPAPLPPEDSGTLPVALRTDESALAKEPATSSQLDGIESQLKAVDSVSNGQPAQGDLGRYPDALSSPGSTVQSNLTTTIHEGSADTSPDHEEPQYSGRADDEMEDKPEKDRSREPDDHDAEPKLPEISPRSRDSAPAAVSGVEAQLLEENAAAQLSQNTVPSAPVGQPTNVTARVLEEMGGTTDAEASLDGVADYQSTSVTNTTPENQPSQQITLGTATLASPAAAPAIGTTESQDAVTVEPMDINGADTPHQTNASSVIQPEGSSALHSPPAVQVQPATADIAPLLPVTPITPIAADAPRSDLPRKPQPTTAIQSTPSAAAVAVKESALLVAPGNAKEALQPLSAPQLKLLANKIQDRRRRSVPTVIFGKQPKKPRAADDSSLVVSREQSDHIPSDDYFTPLFIEGFTRQSSWMKPIEKLLNQAHKTVSTPDQYVSILDHQACKILRRVYHLQQHDKWSLRQPIRCPEPTRPPSHWDVLLQEMKWMRTDFREERKWKRAIARNLAYACAEWVSLGPVERLALQVNAVIPPASASSGVDATTVDALATLEEPLPELIHSDSIMGDSPQEQEEELPEVSIQTIAPSTLFALHHDEVVFNLQPSKTADELLANLPMYGSPLKIPKSDLVGPDFDPDARWRRPALPLSKYVEGEMVLAVKPPPRKRSRYHYENDTEDDSGDEVIFGAPTDHGVRSDPENTNVALFNPDMKATRDRIHASHQFRPPTEFAMPSQSFYENRLASQWTWAEDNRLKSLVCEYSYNWSLISTLISSRSQLVSGPERRTPWECFERWVNLEGLPPDFARSPYFKTYQTRIDAAQAAIAAQNEKAMQQVGANGALIPAQKRRPTTTVRVERRRNQRHLTLIDAMRKLAKKREAAAHRAQQQANVAAVRKANEAPRQQGPNKTPRDYSLMRWERDQQLAERMALYARRNDVPKRAIQQQGQPHNGQLPGTPGTAATAQVAAQVAAASSLNGAARLNIPGQLSVPAQPRPTARPPIQAPAGVASAVQAAQLPSGLVPPLPMSAIPQAQLQAALQAQHRLPLTTPQPDMNLVMQARRIQDQQRATLQLQQQQHHQQQQAQQQPQPQIPQQHPLSVQQQQQQMGQINGTQGSPTPMRSVMNNINQGAFMSNAQAMMASFNAQNGGGVATSPGAGLNMPSLSAGSPRGPAIPPQQLPLVAQRLRDLEIHLRKLHPQAPPDVLRNLATEQLGRIIVQSQHSAMNAASGGAGQQAMTAQQAMNGMAATTSPHQYAQLLRAQQAQQAAAQQQAGQHQRQASGSATPVPGK